MLLEFGSGGPVFNKSERTRFPWASASSGLALDEGVDELENLLAILGR